jgi:Mg-chelatase subunit ChlD
MHHFTHHRPNKVFASDRIGLVGFNDTGFVIAKPAQPHAAWLQERVHKLHSKVSGSSTNIADGLRMSLSLIDRTPRGILRRCWLLTDGYPNRESSAIMGVVEQARQAHCNINCIGFGDRFDKTLLCNISAATHNGQFITAKSLTQLTDALISTDTGQHRRRRHRAETTVLAIDLSGSMMQSMAGSRKIDIVEQAILQLLYYKQRMFA